MGSIGKKIFTVAVGLLLAAGIPYLASTAAHADPGCGCHAEKGHDGGCCREGGCQCCEGECDCECGCPKGAGHHGGMHDNMVGGHGGQHGKHAHGAHMGDGPPMKEGMARHMEQMRGTIGKLRAVEAKMESLKGKDDAAFRSASLEHAKLLTDLQESHLKHMEGMMGGGK